MSNSKSRRYWQANVTVISVLLLIWAVVSIGGGVLFIEWMNRFTIGKIPLGFWIANQGSMIVFVVLILVYAVIMDSIDRKYRSEKPLEGNHDH